jgi:hypothetical protein
MKKSFKPNLPQRRSESLNWNSMMMVVTLHLITHDCQPMQDVQDGIH